MAQPVPVSVKGVLVEAGGVLLLMNERDEWELPGGRMEDGETPEQCLVREFQEETGATIEVGQILAASIYEVLPGRSVLIIAYAVDRRKTGPLTVSTEHRQMRWLPVDDLPAADLPESYRSAIELAQSSK